MAETIDLGIVGIKNVGEYNSQTNYEKLNVVTYQGSSYCAIKNSQGILPTNTEYWQIYAEKGEKGDVGPQGPIPEKGIDYYTAADRAEFSGEIASDVHNEVIQQVGNISNGSPLKASEISEMLDTSRLYILLTDGYVYYYDGTNWVRGWIYQSEQIGESSVNYENLDSYLKSKVNKELIDKKDLYILKDKLLDDTTHIIVDSVQNYCLRLPTNKKYIIKIDKDTLAQRTEYRVSYCDGSDGSNFVKRNIKLTGFKASSNQIILENPYDESNWYILILDDQTYPYSFLNLKTNIYDIPLDKIAIYEFNDFIDNEKKLKYVANKIINIDDFNKNLMLTNLCLHGYPYWSGATMNVGEISGTLSSNQKSSFIYLPANTPIYCYTKSSGNYIMSYDEDLDISSFIKITDGEKIIFNNEIYYRKELIYETNKFIVGIDKLSNVDYKLILSKIPISNENVVEINSKKLNNQIPIKNWYTFGDSITNKNYRALINYIDWTCKDINVINYNYAVSAMGYKKGNNNFTQQLSNLTNYNPETDIITVMGSINDLEYVDNSLGTLGDTTMDTLYGAMYTFFNTLFTNYPGVRVGIISPIVSIATHNNATSKNRMLNYIQALKDTAELFNITFINIFNCGNLRPCESSFLNEYYEADGENNNHQIDTGGVHPNSRGHQLFYARIREFIKTL